MATGVNYINSTYNNVGNGIRNGNETTTVKRAYPAYGLAIKKRQLLATTTKTGDENDIGNGDDNDNDKWQFN